MTRNSLVIASLAMVVAILGLALAVGSALPADTQLPTHWNLAGEADRFSGKWAALLMPAGLVAGVSLLLYFLPALEPRGENLKRSQGLYLWAWAGMLLIGAAVELVTVSAALGWGIPADRLIMGVAGIMLILIGNQLGKSRSMYMAGIRTPWTLASEEVWIKTHRLGGKLMVSAGLVMVLASLLPVPPEWRGVVIGLAVGIAVVVPTIYSFLLWRREKKDQPSG